MDPRWSCGSSVSRFILVSRLACVTACSCHGSSVSRFTLVSRLTHVTVRSCYGSSESRFVSVTVSSVSEREVRSCHVRRSCPQANCGLYFAVSGRTCCKVVCCFNCMITPIPCSLGCWQPTHELKSRVRTFTRLSTHDHTTPHMHKPTATHRDLCYVHSSS